MGYSFDVELSELSIYEVFRTFGALLKFDQNDWFFYENPGLWVRPRFRTHMSQVLQNILIKKHL